MGLTRRDAWTLGILLTGLAALLALRSWDLKPRPFPVTSGPAAPAPRVDLNAASAAEIEALPGVGPTLAAEIVRNRPFEGLDDLHRISGLGPRALDRLAPRVRFGGAP